jgi:hypothetical protein
VGVEPGAGVVDVEQPGVDVTVCGTRNPSPPVPGVVICGGVRSGPLPGIVIETRPRPILLPVRYTTEQPLVMPIEGLH